MPRLRYFLVLLAALLLAGCRTATQHAPRNTGPTLVYHTPSDKELNQRIDELQRAGHTREVADRKARTEFARNAWQYEATAPWADQKAREQRSANRESMEKALAELPLR